jgi:DNA-binding transcriptional regulator GbsR (MarR family)
LNVQVILNILSGSAVGWSARSELDRVRQSLVQLWGRLGPLWGIAPTTARVHAWLLALPPGDPERLAGERIAADMGMSRGGVSMALRELCDWGLVHPERPLGTRRILYRAETDLEKAIRSIVETRKRREWDPILASVREWSSALEGDRSEDAQHVRSVLHEIESVVALVDSMARSFLSGGMLQRMGLQGLVAAARVKKRKARR